MNQRIFFVCLISVLLASCGSVGMMVSPNHTYSTNDVLKLKHPVKNFFQQVTDVGKSLGYEVAGTDPIKNSIVLADDNSAGMGVLIGKMGYKHVTLELQPDRRTITLDLEVLGNFSDATQEAGVKRLEDLKAALVAQIR